MSIKKCSPLCVGLGLWLLLGAGPVAQAQRGNAQFSPYSTVSFGGGTSTYIGDMAGYGNLIKTALTLPRWNAGFAYTRQFTPRLAARAALTYARITGDDYNYSQSSLPQNAPVFARNLHFRNDLKEFALTGLYNFVKEGRMSEKRPKLSPYIFLGVAVVAHAPEARSPVDETNPANSRVWVKLQPLGTEGQGQPGYEKPYSLITLAIPAGIGVKYKLNESFNIAAEVGYRYTFTDYLDDLGGNYPADPAVLSGVARQLSDRRLEPFAARVNQDRTPDITSIVGSNPTNNPFIFATRTGVPRFPLISKDAYILTTFQLQYIIPGKIKCPVIK
jgi:hypothetical protein